MLKEIEITNFKAIGETVKLPIRPITLLFGANSVGKSSILQCLLMIAQSIENDRNDILRPRGSFIDVGNYKNFIYTHDTSKNFAVKFTIDLDGYSLFDNLLNYNEYGMIDLDNNRDLGDIAEKFKRSLGSYKTGSLSLTFQFDETKESDSKCSRIDLYLGEEKDPVFSCLEEPSDFVINFNHPYWSVYWNIFQDYIHESYLGWKVNDPELSSDTKNELMKLFSSLNSETLGVGDVIIQAHIILLQDSLKRKDSSRSAEYIKELEVLNLIENQTEKILKFYFTSDNGFYLYGGLFPTEMTGMTLWMWIDKNYKEFHKKVDSGVMIHPGILVLLLGNVIKGAALNPNSYVGPLRRQPERYYVIEHKENNEIQRLFNHPGLIDLVNQEFKNLQIRYRLEVVRLRSDGLDIDDVFQLQFVDENTDIRMSIKDVGFGFSQILPIIIKSVVHSYERILIEQPELHLHPAMQAEMADIFIRSAKGYELANPELELHESLESLKRNHFLLETHSEHLILRLLRRVRETTEGNLPVNVPPITPDDISVLYVQPGEKGAEVIHIPITEDGDFARPWPQGFFSERAKELF